MREVTTSVSMLSHTLVSMFAAIRATRGHQPPLTGARPRARPPATTGAQGAPLDDPLPCAIGEPEAARAVDVTVVTSACTTARSAISHHVFRVSLAFAALRPSGAVLIGIDTPRPL